MNQPTVRCAGCGARLDEPSSTPPDERLPCGNCGSTARTFEVSLSDELRSIGEAYARSTKAANDRIEQLAAAQAAASRVRTGLITADAVIVAPEASASASAATAAGTAHDATVKMDSAIAAELMAERDRLTQTAIRTLIEVVRVGQEESAIAADRLNHLTEVLVRWTKFIGMATAVAVGVSILALVLSVVTVLATRG